MEKGKKERADKRNLYLAKEGSEAGEGREEREGRGRGRKERKMNICAHMWVYRLHTCIHVYMCVNMYMYLIPFPYSHSPKF